MSVEIILFPAQKKCAKLIINKSPFLASEAPWHNLACLYCVCNINQAPRDLHLDEEQGHGVTASCTEDLHLAGGGEGLKNVVRFISVQHNRSGLHFEGLRRVGDEVGGVEGFVSAAQKNTG